MSPRSIQTAQEFHAQTATAARERRSLSLKTVISPHLILNVVEEERVYVENATALKPNWGKYMGNTVKWTIFPAHTTWENYVLVTVNVTMEIVDVTVAGKVTDVNAPHQRNTVWILMDLYAVGEEAASVANASALMTKALALCANTALDVAIPAQTTGTVSTLMAH